MGHGEALGFLEWKQERAKAIATQELSKQAAPLIKWTQSGGRLFEVFKELGILFRSRKWMKPVARWVEALESGQTGRILSVVCPDYATGQDATGAVSYTFNGLGGGVGLVAKRISDVIPRLHEALCGSGLSVEFAVFMADFEATEANWSRVGLCETCFRNQLARSNKAFKTLVGDTPVEVGMLTERFSEWETVLDECRKRATLEHMPQKEVRSAMLARKKFYERWQGVAHLSSEEATQALLSQVPEYLAIGRIASSLGEPTLLLGADSVPMSPFLKVENPDLPVLYLDRPSY